MNHDYDDDDDDFENDGGKFVNWRDRRTGGMTGSYAPDDVSEDAD